jgi:carboxylesterase
MPAAARHGTEPADLLDIRWTDWIDSMRAEYRALKQRHGVVHLAGVCLGALVALEVARLENHQDKLALYARRCFWMAGACRD